jgi:manganese transport protein
MVVQYLSAKLGIVTGRTLPELVRDRLARPAAWGMWVQGEVIAMATDVAEFLGAALGLNLLFGVPMLPAGLITGLITVAVLGLRARGRRRFELAIMALLGLVGAGFLYETLRIGPSVPRSLHGLVPGLEGAGSLYLATGILGATVMPHVIYLHSALTKDRAAGRDQVGRLLRFQQLDVFTALGLAGLVNMAMLAVAARAFHTPALAGLDTLGQAHAELGRLAGGTAALVFAAALLASGLSSSSVGTYAGEVIMAGFVKLRVPLLARRAITMLPALAILAASANPGSTLVLSQVVLSFGIPFALIPLVLLTSRRDVMGRHVNRRRTTITGGMCAATIVTLNILLLYQQFR